jgi:hypothetical protein
LNAFDAAAAFGPAAFAAEDVTGAIGGSAARLDARLDVPVRDYVAGATDHVTPIVTVDEIKSKTEANFTL